MARPLALARPRLAAPPAAGLALLTLALLNLMWGGSLPATKVALASFGPFTLATARLLLAATLFLAVLGPRRLRDIPASDALRMAALGVVGFACVQVFQALGTSLTTSATATVLASTAPLWIAVLAPALLRERLHPLTVLGVLLALGGVAIIGLGPADASGLTALTGNLVVLLSSASAALYTVMGKRLLLRYSPLVFCTVSCIGGAVASVPFGLHELATTSATPDLGGWLLLAYLAVLVTFVGFGIWFWALRSLPASRAGALMFLQPVSGLVLAWVVLGDPLTPTFLVGCALVLLGVYLAVNPGPRLRRPS